MVITMVLVWSLQCIEMVIGYLHCLYRAIFTFIMNLHFFLAIIAMKIQSVYIVSIKYSVNICHVLTFFLKIFLKKRTPKPYSTVSRF